MINNDARIRRIEIFEDTMNMCKTEKLANSIKQAIKDTAVYDEKITPLREIKDLIR